MIPLALEELNRKTRVKALELLEADLKMYNLEVSPEKWDPLTIFTGEFSFDEFTQEQKRGVQILEYDPRILEWLAIPARGRRPVRQNSLETLRLFCGHLANWRRARGLISLSGGSLALERTKGSRESKTLEDIGEQ